MDKRGLSVAAIIAIVVVLAIVGGAIAYTSYNNNVNLSPNSYTLKVSKTGDGSGTVVSDPIGINCGSDCSEKYSAKTNVELRAIADSGSTFAGWDVCSGTSNCNIVMTSDKKATARFVANPINHLECISNTCTLVQGAGANECSTNSDCMQGNETNQTHSICSGNSCIAVQGPGANECILSSDCSSNNNTNITFPDLIISSMSYYIDNSTNGTFENKTVYVYTTVKNIGEANAGTSILKLLLSPYGTIDNLPVNSLMPGQSTTKTRIYSNLPSGQFYMVNATADYNNQIQESNEFNNYGYVAFQT